MKLRMSGTVYEACCAASSVPGEESWPKPTVQAWGYGRRYIYEVDVRQAELILSHVELVGNGLGYAPDPDSRQEGRVCRDWVQRERRRLSDAGHRVVLA